MTAASDLSATVARVSQLVNNYHRDAPFRAPETVPEFELRLLNNIWAVLVEAQDRRLGSVRPATGRPSA